MKMGLIYLFVVVLFTGNPVLAQTSQLAISILGSEDVTSTGVVNGIVLGDSGERSEEDTRESGDEEDNAKIGQGQNLPFIPTLTGSDRSLHFMACIEHCPEMALLPPE